MVNLRYLIMTFLSLNSEGVEVILEDSFEMGREVVVMGSLEEGASYLVEALILMGGSLLEVALRGEEAWVEVAFHSKDLEATRLELGDNNHYQEEEEEASCKEEADNNCTHHSTGLLGEADSNSYHKQEVNAIGFHCGPHRSRHLHNCVVHLHHHNSLRFSVLNLSLLMSHHLFSEQHN
jgi:hypothetical protein